jgi:alpha-2-macroglobulin
VLADIDLSAGATVEQALGGQILTELLSTRGATNGSARRFSLIAKDQPMDIALSQPGYSLALAEYQPEQFKVTNTGTAPLFVSLLREGIPAAGTEQASSQGLRLSSHYTDLAGQPIDISTLKQGSDFIAWVSVENISPEAQSQLALTQVFAAGFELRSAMLAEEAQSAAVSYQKTGDDRLYTYLDLAAAGKSGARVVLKATLNATYAGRFYLPAWSVQSMYKPQIQSRITGQWVEIKP